MCYKLLMINDFKIAGGAETVFNKTIDLLKNDKDVIVDSFVGSNDYKTANGPFEYVYSLKFAKLLYQRLLDFQPDIIHLGVFHHVLTSSIFSSIKRYRKFKPSLKLVYAAHDYYFIFPNSALLTYSGESFQVQRDKVNYIKLWFNTRVDHRGLMYSTIKKIQWSIFIKLIKGPSMVDLVICPSAYMKDSLLSRYTFDIDIVRNPVTFSENQVLGRLTSRKNSEDLKIVFFGRLSIEKGLENFIDSLPKDENITLDVFGDGPIRKFLSEKYDDNKQVKFLGKRSHAEIIDLLSSYDAMVLPSLWPENAPMSLIEASKAGLILLGSDFGGIKEISEICGNHFLFNPYDKDSVKKAIIGARDNKHRLKWEENRLKVFEPEFYIYTLKKSYSKVLNN